jgi:UDPglucose 6-dehydrogenase
MERPTIERVSVTGAGYSGLAYASCLASKGIRVSMYEKDLKKRNLLSDGKVPFYEPSLANLFAKVLADGWLRLTSSTKEAVDESDATFVSVGTPSLPSGRINLSHVKDSIAEIGEALTGKTAYHIVVIRSTVVPGTTTNVVQPILERTSRKQAGKEFGLAMQPEFLREGSSVQDVFHPNRIVIGATDPATANDLYALSKRLHDGELPPVIKTTPTTAEMIKYASNSFLAAKVSFINEIANLCQRQTDVDVIDVAEGIGLDPRIGREFLNAGIGFGGSCLPKDLTALLHHARSLNYRPKLLDAVAEVNRWQARQIIEIARRHLGRLKGRRVAVLGLTFKPDTDDIRNSPSLTVVRLLLQQGCKVAVLDPQGLEGARKILGRRVAYCHDEFDCVKDADCCFVCTSWDQFKSLDLRKVGNMMRTPLIVDGRRIFDPGTLPRNIAYEAIGYGRTATSNRFVK